MQKNFLLLQNKTILNDKKANFQNIENMLKDISDIDFIVLPELWAIGWNIKDFKKIAEEEHGETLEFLKKLAIKHNSNIIGGSFLRTDEKGRAKNSCPIIKRNGELLGYYDKIHLFQDEKNYVTKGNTPRLVELEGLKIGLSICYDIRFPELFREYLKGGADVLINMSIWPKIREEHYLTLMKARGIENQAWFLGVSACGEIIGKNLALGKSSIISPNGEIKGELGYQEGILSYIIDSEENKKVKKFMNILSDIQKIDFQIKE